ncbi:hypothetical protein J2T41_004556 [Pseudomonas citronellolis]|uniref:hypothetical protein n=1 Tax=Pseudomonas citronellolis TaxID=53408 RepID=UPI0020A1DF67|nr:hypothetical protein [Pseudomonas citronellolis]MCP1644917.1 hypothetical protein [Pseudomonas citronellolis]MCP1667862.1 hypothetical protein [Pseudomonas citronellolis]MCP1699042.1 hypothetical protein [Pseudomonas citronellolis]MCP1704969.1 hypothetical protein [Pseudomonas citronellolis]MCP1799605.1 hypothetical protein [Pseudomonas citronellolis]
MSKGAARSASLPTGAMDLARVIDALSHGLSLQRPQHEPGTVNQAGRIIADLLETLVAAGKGKPEEQHSPPQTAPSTKTAKSTDKRRKKAAQSMDE